MSAADILVIVAAVAALAGLGWFFFGPRKVTAAVLAGGVQRLEVMVKGGYRPDVIRVRQGVPAQLTFDRQESGDCTSRVVFPDFRASAALPAFQRTTVRLTPASVGTFGLRAAKVGADTMLAQIIKLVLQAQASRAPIQRLADMVSGYFVPAVMSIAIVTFAVWFTVGPAPALTLALVAAVSVLIIACPCALGLATPLSVMVG